MSSKPVTSSNLLSKIPSFVINIVITSILALALRFVLHDFVNSENQTTSLIAVFLTIGIGVFVILKIAELIEHTTAVLKNKTGLAGGFLQSLGTAFPDMVIGVVAAFLSLQEPDPTKKIGLAIIAASTTFGSNLYNVGHAAWCVWRQNRANHLGKAVKIFVLFGEPVTPMAHHGNKPRIQEIDNANSLIVSLSILTFVVVMSMVLFGKTTSEYFPGDLYQLNPFAGFLVLLAAIGVIFMFRKNTSAETEDDDENEFAKFPMFVTLIALFFSGIIILLTAESMVTSIQHFSHITQIPVFIAGVLAGLIGCLGEMVVVHNFTVNPKGRLGDALVGVGMDNIITTIGASLVAIMGGIFLGSGPLIIIFAGVLALNSVLIWQNSILKNEFMDEEEKKR